MRKLLLCLMCLCVPISMVTASNTTNPADEEVWITIGTDALETVRAEFTDREWNVFVERHLTNPDVAVMRVTERQIIVISRLMHKAFGRCGGFLAHASYEEALAAGERALQNTASKLALNYTLDRATEVNTVLPNLAASNIASTITSLSSYSTRYYTSQSSVDAANWLKGQWETMASGRSDISVELYNHSWLMPSVVMTITGAHQPQDIIVMGGHLDSINQSGSIAPGADDDASGIATLTEILRAALANGYTPARTVKIMAYAAEEVGLRGSGDLAQAAVNNGDNIIGVLQLDMTNYQGSTQDIWLMQDYTNAAQNTFVENLIDTYTGATRSTSSCGYGCSDHASWHNRGFATSMPFESHMNDYNPHIHTANDTLANSGGNATHALKFAKLGASYMIELAKGGLNGNPGPDPGPVGGGGGPTATEVQNGDTLNNLNASTGTQTLYFIDIPAGASNFTVTTSGGSGDCDLYVKRGSAPTTSNSDCSSTNSNNNESCNTPSPAQDRWYIMLSAYSTYSGMSLSVNYDGGGSNTAPTASFSHSTNNLTASFTDNSSDSDGTISSWSWNFGDGTSSSNQSPSHTYAASGTYSVTLTVTDNDGATDSANASVTVTASNPNNAPVASFSHSTNDLTATFSDNSTDSDGSVTSWSWNFGDGNTSSQQNPSHTYASDGTYTVTLNVTDNDGATDSATASVSVTSGGSGSNILDNGVPVTGLGTSSGEWIYYQISVPAGASNLSITTSGGSGDADLYVRFGSQPTSTSYDCRPYRNGNSETCSFATPSEGIYYVGLRAYSTFSGVTLTGSFTEPGGGPSCDPVSWTESNLSGNQGAWQHFTLVVPAGCTGTLNVTMSGGSGDADLYVRKDAQPTTSSYQCRPYRTGNSETCNISNAGAGTWYVSIRAYSNYSGVTLQANWQ